MTGVNRRTFVAFLGVIVMALLPPRGWARDPLPCAADVQQANIRVIQSIVGNGVPTKRDRPRYDVVKELISDDLVGSVGAGIPYGREYRGWQGYLELEGEIKKFWADTHVENPAFIPFGNDKVIINFTLDGHIAKNGRHVRMPVTTIWGVKDGKAVSFQVFYFDTKGIADLASK